MQATSPDTPLRSGLARMLAVVVAVLTGVALLGACTGERPTLAATSSTPSTATSTTTVDAATTTTETTIPGAASLGPESLLGYIATPTGAPVVHTEASEGSPTIEIGPTTSAGAPTTFAVVGDPTGDTTGWLQVVLPTRPNGATAWVPAGSVTITKTPFRLFVELGTRELRVERDGTELLAATVAVGTDENPTPLGASYITELIDNQAPEGAYGPYAFGLALHSDTLTEFAGGPGQVGIHGTNQPGLIGQAVSHGCVRLRNADIEALVGLGLPLGAPVFVTA
jgi:lipoprotein-anchoring transpeptidase ErfK/SrfK